MATPLGDGWAIIRDAGWHATFWVVLLDNGAIVDFDQHKIRVKRNYSMGIGGLTDEKMKEIIK